jgi:hypothetical protein
LIIANIISCHFAYIQLCFSGGLFLRIAEYNFKVDLLKMGKNDFKRYSLLFTSLCITRALIDLGYNRWKRARARKQEMTMKYKMAFATMIKLQQRVSTLEEVVFNNLHRNETVLDILEDTDTDTDTDVEFDGIVV